MKDWRHGSDFQIRIKPKINGSYVEPDSIDGLRVQLRDRLGNRIFPKFATDETYIYFTFYGIEHKALGVYGVTLYANYKSVGQAIKDFSNAFNLVDDSMKIRPEGTDEYEGFMTEGFLDLEADMGIGLRGDDAYQFWLNDGHTGTRHDFVEWMQEPSRLAAEDARALMKQFADEEEMRVKNELERDKTFEQLAKNAQAATEDAQKAATGVSELLNEISTSEKERIANERQRVTNEQQRIANEQQRTGAEAARNATEAQRMTNELERQNNERQRNSIFNTQMGNVTQAVNDVQQAVESSQQAAESAAQAVTDAQQAVGSAEQATSNANAAVLKANTAAENADAKAKLVEDNIATNTQRVNTAVTASNEAKAEAQSATETASGAVTTAQSAVDLANQAKAIAEGKATSYVFKTKAELDAWLLIADNVSKLRNGDNLYIIATDTPDYWWADDQLAILESDKVDLSGYVKFTDLANYATTSAVNNKQDKGVVTSNTATALSLAITAANYTKDTIIKCPNVLSSITLTSVAELAVDIVMFFTTGENVDNFLIVPTGTTLVNEVVFEPNTSYVMAIFGGSIVIGKTAKTE